MCPYLYLTGLQDQPPIKWQDIIFDVQIETLALTNLHLEIHKGILEFDLHICTWLASNGLQVARYILIKELKS